MEGKGVFLAIMLLAAGMYYVWNSCLCLQWSVVDAVLSLVLTSVPSSSEPYCPGPEFFTCNATDITPRLCWELNDTSIGVYTFDPMDRYPLNVNVTSPLIDSIQVIYATLRLDGNSIDIISTLNKSDVLDLNGFSIHCEDLIRRESNEVNISVVSLGIKNHYT